MRKAFRLWGSPLLLVLLVAHPIAPLRLWLLVLLPLPLLLLVTVLNRCATRCE